MEEHVGRPTEVFTPHGEALITRERAAVTRSVEASSLAGDLRGTSETASGRHDSRTWAPALSESVKVSVKVGDVAGWWKFKTNFCVHRVRKRHPTASARGLTARFKPSKNRIAL